MLLIFKEFYLLVETHGLPLQNCFKCLFCRPPPQVRVLLAFFPPFFEWQKSCTTKEPQQKKTAPPVFTEGLHTARQFTLNLRAMDYNGPFLAEPFVGMLHETQHSLLGARNLPVGRPILVLELTDNLFSLGLTDKEKKPRIIGGLYSVSHGVPWFCCVL